MPSYVIHLSCARCACELLAPMDDAQRNLFFLGNMIADMSADKHYTHFWNDETYPMLVRRPDLNWFLKKYGDALHEPYVLGYYAHLLLDYRFVDVYWEKHFRFYGANREPNILYDEVKYVEVLEQQRLYDRYDFFSKKWYYGDYDRMNAYFARKYKVQFPGLEFGDAEWKQVHRITEIDWSYAPEAMNRTKNLLDVSVAAAEKNHMDTKPQLQVFDLEELDILIKETAKKVAEVR